MKMINKILNNVIKQDNNNLNNNQTIKQIHKGTIILIPFDTINRYYNKGLNSYFCSIRTKENKQLSFNIFLNNIKLNNDPHQFLVYWLKENKKLRVWDISNKANLEMDLKDFKAFFDEFKYFETWEDLKGFNDDLKANRFINYTKLDIIEALETLIKNYEELEQQYNKLKANK